MARPTLWLFPLSFLFLFLSISGAGSQSTYNNRERNIRACDYLSKVEAEAIVRTSLELTGPADNAFTCSYTTPGSVAPANGRSVTFNIFSWASPRADAYDAYRKSFAPNFPAPTTLTEVAGFADGAMWLWTPSLRLGKLVAFKAGTLQVMVEIGGMAEDDAVRSARATTAKALGGSAGTGFAYTGAPVNNNRPTATAVGPTENAALLAQVLPQGKSYSQAPYLSESQFLHAVKEVSLDLQGGWSLPAPTAAEQRSLIQNELARYGITVRAGAPVRLRAFVANMDLIVETKIDGQVDNSATVPFHQFKVEMEFLMRVASRRNGKLHAINASPAACSAAQGVFESSPFQKAVLGDNTQAEMRSAFSETVKTCLDNIDANRSAEEKPWEVAGWSARDKAAVDAEFTKLMSPATPIDKGNFSGLTVQPQIVLTPAADSPRCAPASDWNSLWNVAVRTAGFTQAQPEPTLRLFHYYTCVVPKGLTPFQYYGLFDQVRLVETNVVFALNGNIVRRGGTILLFTNTQLALTDDLDPKLKVYLPQAVSRFLLEVGRSR